MVITEHFPLNLFTILKFTQQFLRIELNDLTIMKFPIVSVECQLAIDYLLSEPCLQRRQNGGRTSKKTSKTDLGTMLKVNDSKNYFTLPSIILN